MPTNQLVDRAKMTIDVTSSNADTTKIYLSAAVSGYQAFADAGVLNDNDVRYIIEDGTDWEIGSGTFASVGNTVTRQATPDASSNSGSQLATLSSSAQVFISPAAADLETLASRVPVRNSSAVSTISAGSLVYSVGTVGGSDRIEVAPFDADAGDASAEELTVVGVLDRDLTVSGGATPDGYAVWFGPMKASVFTAFANGDILYASGTPGSYTTTAPAAPATAIASCVVLNATSGLVFVRPRLGLHLGEVHDVSLSSATSGDILKYDGTKWVNNSLPNAGIAGLSGAAYTGTVSLKDGVISDLALNFSADTDTGIYRSVSGAYIFVSNGAAAGAVSGEGLTTQKYYSSANNNLSASANPTTSFSTLTLSGSTQIFASAGTIPPAQSAGVIKVTTNSSPVISVGADCVHDDIGTTLGTAGVYIVSWVSDGTSIHATVTGTMT